MVKGNGEGGRRQGRRWWGVGGLGLRFPVARPDGSGVRHVTAGKQGTEVRETDKPRDNMNACLKREA